jgi:sugar phosphate isomerase/epimerase
MIYGGLVSITFRMLTPREIVGLVADSGLQGIEWGGDVHVPHGNVERAREVRAMTEDAGLCVPAYGSYYRVGHQEPCPFEDVLQSAVALGTPIVRVWAGKTGTDGADDAYWERVVADSRRIGDLAAEAGVTVVYEFHGGTLTDTNASARRLLERVGRKNVRSYWQPPRGASTATCLEGLDMIMPWLTHVHVFSWREPEQHGPAIRLPLAAGERAWSHFLPRIASSGRDCFAEIEFVRGDNPAQFLEDASVLKQWLARANQSNGSG